MVADPETRKAIAQRAIDRAAARGAPIDQDPAFIALLSDWIRGDIEFKEMRERYLDLLALQAAERRGSWRSRVGRTRLAMPNEPSEA
ncbi:hypothetical protein JZX87_26665 [Agrobacterium sp. Ap1]|uniref:hypothetical protein n=1 Tax=Agrobacterium sp. Ap1 TaxID=2815337 RepID=UPI001A8E6A32|nr:hypothetical protein [Agrobacterium sp. Ap1]MBO0144735.1 hypothetical protein [Agrobacterium sp. Ap1]